MTETQLEAALEQGANIGEAIKADVACFGEMGIGNTSSASLPISKILGQSVLDLAGRGTGLDDEGVQRKSELLQMAAAGRRPNSMVKRPCWNMEALKA